MFTALLLTQTTEAHRELPVSPIWYGLIALGTFALLLGVTWSFRNVGKHH